MQPISTSCCQALLMVFALGVANDSPGADLQIGNVAFKPPVGPTARYHAAVEVRNTADRAITLKSVSVNDTNHDYFTVCADNRLAADNRLGAGKAGRILVTLPWENGQPYCFEITATADQDVLRAQADAVAPQGGGYWDAAWRHYKVVDLIEEAGLPRHQEPVRVAVNFHARRLREPARELRLLALAPDNRPVQVPFQVLSVSSVQSVDEKYESTVTATLLFYADVPAYGSQRYLVLYDNPDATARVKPETDLRVDGEGLALRIENPYYRVTLARQSGQIDGIFIKQGVDQQLSHGNNAIHWNPGCYSPPRPWGHTYDWNPPAGHHELRGPLVYVLKRWGPFPQIPEVWVSVTYKFYAHAPHIEMSSTIVIRKDIDVLALRNDEMVFDAALFSHLGWRDHAGRVHSVPLGQNPGLGKGYTEVLAADTPWLCFFLQNGRYGFGGVRLAYDATSTSRHDVVKLNENTFVTAPAGIVYWYRALAYHFFPAFSNPKPLLGTVKVGSVYHETNAYLAFPLGKTPETWLEPMDQAYFRLHRPLRVSSVDWGRDHLLSADLRKTD